VTAVAVAGLGAMGSRIAARLVAAGHERTAWNRSAGKVEPLAGLGAFPAATSAETGRPGRLLTRRAEMIATIKEARPGLAHIRLARAADGTGTGRWGAAEQEAALATMPAP
jgi:3-hydroxyacyl-CoA dehydrogenase